MENISMKKMTEWMKDIDFCMMTTLDGRGSMHSRPMSNNKEVDYSGDTYFFTMKDTGKVRQIMETPRTSLTYQGAKGLFIQVYGESHLIEQKAKMKEFWHKELDTWFQDGIDTEGLCMIRVRAHKIHYWQQEKEGDVKID